MSKLTKEDVKLIRILLSSKQEHIDISYNLMVEHLKHKRIAKTLTHQDIADKFGVSKAAIQKISDGDNWTND